MLKTFTKFVLQRRGRAQQPPKQVVEDDHTTDPASASENLTKPAEPQLNEPSPPAVSEDLQVIRSCSMSEIELRAELETISTEKEWIDDMMAAMAPHGLRPAVTSDA